MKNTGVSFGGHPLQQYRLSKGRHSVPAAGGDGSRGQRRQPLCKEPDSESVLVPFRREKRFPAHQSRSKIRPETGRAERRIGREFQGEKPEGCKRFFIKELQGEKANSLQKMRTRKVVSCSPKYYHKNWNGWSAVHIAPNALGRSYDKLSLGPDSRTKIRSKLTFTLTHTMPLYTLPPLLTADCSTIIAKGKATAEELKALAESNGYRRGAYREKDSTRDNGKYNKKTIL
jgi:hypothetical protein